MTGTIQISGKANNGIIFVVGGDTFDDFYTNLLAAHGGDQAVVDQTIAEAVRLITPMSTGSTPAPQQQYQQPQQSQGYQSPAQQGYQPPQGGYNDNRQPAGPPPGQQAPLCPGHNQPGKWVPPGVAKATNRPYPGFWACAVSAQGDRSCRFPK